MRFSGEKLSEFRILAPQSGEEAEHRRGTKTVKLPSSSQCYRKILPIDLPPTLLPNTPWGCQHSISPQKTIRSQYAQNSFFESAKAWFFARQSRVTRTVRRIDPSAEKADAMIVATPDSSNENLP